MGIRPEAEITDPQIVCSLATECEKLDQALEKSIADEGLAADIIEWPEY